MRLRVLSDLHVEAAAFDPPAIEADVVVLAGDVGNGLAALTWVRRAFARGPVVYVPGNHEFYGGHWEETLESMRRHAAHLDIDFLECDEVVHDGVRFLGCTLWTDFAWYAPDAVRPRPADGPVLTVPQAMETAQAMMADYRAIAVTAADGGVRGLRPADTVVRHGHSRQWLAGAQATPHNGPTVVVTHHLPGEGSIDPYYRQAPTNPAFVSDCASLMARPELWIHGHTHASCDYRQGRCRVVCNPRGYPRRRGGSFENERFDPCLVVDVA